jgi:head-tail adaptor
MKAGDLDRLIQFQRAGQTPGAFGPVDDDFVDHGSPVWAQRKDVSDGERARAGLVEAQLMTRFTIRWSDFTAAITAKDLLVCDGVTFNITGIKEPMGRRQWLEISATARAD